MHECRAGLQYFLPKAVKMPASAFVGECAVFLHGGPGLSCHAERTLYGTKLPVHWWDQPRQSAGAAIRYRALLECTFDELARQAVDGPVHVIAHSFGAMLALEASIRMPENIRALTLVAPVHDVVSAYLQIARVLIAQSPGGGRQALEAARDQAQGSRGNPEPVLALARALMADPHFLDLYWAPRSTHRRDWYYELMRGQALFDPAAFESVIQDFARSPPRAAGPIRADMPVDIVLGQFDRVVATDVERPYWQACFPQAAMRVVPTGHMVQLEEAPSMWLGGIATAC